MADLLTGWQGICARLFLYGLLCAAIAATGGILAHRWDQKSYQVLESKFDNFKTETAAAGKVAQTRADAQKALDAKAKENADLDYTNRVVALAADNDRLRIAAARGNTVPAAPAGTRRPDLACFKRADFDTAIDDFIAEISGQVKSGASAVAVSDTAKVWASTVKAGSLPK